MTLTIQAVTFDCEHAPELAAFWAAALGRSVDPAQDDHGSSSPRSASPIRDPGNR